MCKFCEESEIEYQHTNHTKLYIGTFGQSKMLVVEATRCPPFAKCFSKDLPIRSAYFIKFCPECGRDLRVEDIDDE